MAAPRRASSALVGLVGLVACMALLRACSFVPAPQSAPTPSSETAHFNPAMAASAAMPALLMAEDAQAAYGDYKRWSSVLVPLTTLVLPAIVFGSAVLWLFSEEPFFQLTPGSKEGERRKALWRQHPMFANAEEPLSGLVNPDDYEKGLEEAWERAKPKGSTVTVKDKLKQLSTQSNPHWAGNKLSA